MADFVFGASELRRRICEALGTCVVSVTLRDIRLLICGSVVGAKLASCGCAVVRIVCGDDRLCVRCVSVQGTSWWESCS